MSFREFNVDAYNARLEAALADKSATPAAAKEARKAAMRELPVLLESDVLPAVLEALRLHPKVAFVWRQNTGAAAAGERIVRFAFAGCADILGMLKDGRFLAVEVKRPGGMPSPAQVQFLAVVEQNGGLAFVARGVDDVWKALA